MIRYFRFRDLTFLDIDTGRVVKFYFYQIKIQSPQLNEMILLISQLLDEDLVVPKEFMSFMTRLLRDGDERIRMPIQSTLGSGKEWLPVTVWNFPVWLRNKLIYAGLEPVQSHTEKLCIASNYRQLQTINNNS